MPLYLYAVKGQKIRTPVRAVVAIPRGMVKVRVRITLVPIDPGITCANSENTGDRLFTVDRVVVLFWRGDGSLVSQTTVTQDETDVPIPSDAAYVEWRIPSQAIFTTSGTAGARTLVASYSYDRNIMSFIDQSNNMTDIVVRFIFICSGWNTSISTVSSELPINIDIPFCSGCSGDFSPRSALRGIYAVVRNAQNTSLRAILLDSTKTGLVDCSWVYVGDVSQETVFPLCNETDLDLLENLKINYPVTRFIRVMVDRANPAGPLPATIFSIYFTVDKGSIP